MIRFHFNVVGLFSICIELWQVVSYGCFNETASTFCCLSQYAEKA